MSSLPEEVQSVVTPPYYTASTMEDVMVVNFECNCGFTTFPATVVEVRSDRARVWRWHIEDYPDGVSEYEWVRLLQLRPRMPFNMKTAGVGESVDLLEFPELGLHARGVEIVSTHATHYYVREWGHPPDHVVRVPRSYIDGQRVTGGARDTLVPGTYVLYRAPGNIHNSQVFVTKLHYLRTPEGTDGYTAPTRAGIVHPCRVGVITEVEARHIHPLWTDDEFEEDAPPLLRTGDFIYGLDRFTGTQFIDDIDCYCEWVSVVDTVSGIIACSRADVVDTRPDFRLRPRDTIHCVNYGDQTSHEGVITRILQSEMAVMARFSAEDGDYESSVHIENIQKVFRNGRPLIQQWESVLNPNTDVIILPTVSHSELTGVVLLDAGCETAVVVMENTPDTVTVRRDGSTQESVVDRSFLLPFTRTSGNDEGTLNLFQDYAAGSCVFIESNEPNQEDFWAEVVYFDAALGTYDVKSKMTGAYFKVAAGDVHLYETTEEEPQPSEEVDRNPIIRERSLEAHEFYGYLDSDRILGGLMDLINDDTQYQVVITWDPIEDGAKVTVGKGTTAKTYESYDNESPYDKFFEVGDGAGHIITAIERACMDQGLKLQPPPYKPRRTYMAIDKDDNMLYLPGVAGNRLALMKQMKHGVLKRVFDITDIHDVQEIVRIEKDAGIVQVEWVKCEAAPIPAVIEPEETNETTEDT